MADLPVAFGAGQETAAAEGPVFVDETGRRSRRYRRLGVVVGLACAVYAVIIVGTLLSGNSNAPWLPVRGPEGDHPASKVDTPDRPADAIAPTASSGVTASADSDTRGTEGTAKPGTTGEPDPKGSGDTGGKPGASADPDPTDGGGRPDPGPAPTGGGDPAPDPTGGPGSGPGTGPGPDPTVPTTPPTDPSTENPGTGGDGGGGNGDGGAGGGGGGGEVPVGYTAPAPSAPADTRSSAEDARR
ncbi:hypothetical protein [Streptomyces formicae]